MMEKHYVGSEIGQLRSVMSVSYTHLDVYKRQYFAWAGSRAEGSKKPSSVLPSSRRIVILIELKSCLLYTSVQHASLEPACIRAHENECQPSALVHTHAPVSYTHLDVYKRQR